MGVFDSSIDLKQKVNTTSGDISSILKKALDHKDITFEFIGKQIVLKKVKAQAPVTKKRLLTGKVTDETGEPLIGVSVLVKGTTMGTVTDVPPQRRPFRP